MPDQQTRFTGVALMGLFFIIVGFVMIFGFLITVTGNALPDFLEFKSESYSMLLLGIVNIASAAGIFYRSKSTWSFTIVFIVVIIIGDLMNLFFTGTTKVVVALVYVAVLIYMLTREVRVWYNVG